MGKGGRWPLLTPHRRGKGGLLDRAVKKGGKPVRTTSIERETVRQGRVKLHKTTSKSGKRKKLSAATTGKKKTSIASQRREKGPCLTIEEIIWSEKEVLVTDWQKREKKSPLYT